VDDGSTNPLWRWNTVLSGSCRRRERNGSTSDPHLHRSVQQVCVHVGDCEWNSWGGHRCVKTFVQFRGLPEGGGL
jgi:hypothetical protein